MSSNRLHSLFGSRRRLEREDIDLYKETNDPATKNAIEQQVSDDPFMTDALEGWSQPEMKAASMRKLDKTFLPKGLTGWYVVGGTALVAGATAAIIATTYTPGSDSVIIKDDNPIITELMEDQMITLDEADVNIPEPIEAMKPAPKKEQVEPDAIIADFKEIQAEHREDPEIEIAELPVRELDSDADLMPEIIQAHALGKEHFLYDLKLVDYRQYMVKPQVKTRQMILSGTPANQEDKTWVTMETAWKDVDIPYMDYLDKSLRIFNRGNYKKALTRFEIVLESYPEDVNANFYSGVCYYNLGEYILAMRAFGECTFGPYSNFDEEAMWMTALCHEHLGDSAKAKQAFKKIRNAGGHYADQAKEKLK